MVASTACRRRVPNCFSRVDDNWHWRCLDGAGYSYHLDNKEEIGNLGESQNWLRIQRKNQTLAREEMMPMKVER